MKLRPQHIVFLVAVVVVVAITAFTLGGEQPGSIAREGTVITQTVGTAEPNAESRFTIVLQEGNDADHESSHIFDTLQHPAIRTLSLDTATLVLTVSYDSSQVTEESLRQRLAQSGYVARSAEDAVPAELAADGSVQTMYLQTGETLLPTFIRAKAGVPLVLTFSAGTGHLASVSIPELGITQDLTTEGATIRIESPQPGEYRLLCLEGFSDGVLLVE